MWFQQAEAAAYYDHRIQNTIKQMFSERWIGRRGPIT